MLGIRLMIILFLGFFVFADIVSGINIHVLSVYVYKYILKERLRVFLDIRIFIK